MRARRPRSVRSITAWASEPRRIGSGSGSTRPGRSRRSTSQRTPQLGERLEPARGLALARARAPPARPRAPGGPSGAGIGRRSAGRERAAQLERRGRRARRPRDLGQQPASAALPQLVGVERAHVVDERRRAAADRPPRRSERHDRKSDLLRPRHARVEQVAVAREHVLVRREARARRPRPARGARRRRGTARAAGARGSSPSCSPHTNTARKRRARIASGSASSDAGRGVPAPSRTPTAASASSSSSGPPEDVGRQAAELGQRGAQVGRHARVRRRLAVEHRRAAAMRRRPDARSPPPRAPPRSGAGPASPGGRLGRRRRAHRAASSGAPPSSASQIAPRARRRLPATARRRTARVEPVGRRPAVRACPGVRSHVTTSAAVPAGQRGAGEGQHARARGGCGRADARRSRATGIP